MNRFEVALWSLAQIFRRVGRLDLTFADGSSRTCGSGSPAADLVLRHAAASRRLLTGGTLGLAEAYLDQAVDTGDLRALLDWGAANQERWGASGRLALSPFRTLWQHGTRTTKHHQIETMVDHYNLGNDFYAAWLDETMTYSAARFPRPDTELLTAQLHKYERIADHAGIRPGTRVLEIGCGWGGFAHYAASERGAHVTGVTIAAEQADYARKRLSDAGMAGMADVRLGDFRSAAGTFDAVVSIEMIESVDEKTWPALFGAFHDRLRPGGRAVMQAIVIRDDLFDGYRRRRDFIQRYIFPGGQCPSPAVIMKLAAGAGLDVVGREQFGLDYARTLRAWADRFESAWPELQGDHLDERFRRMWLFYLAYCEAGFRHGTIDVGQWVFARR